MERLSLRCLPSQTLRRPARRGSLAGPEHLERRSVPAVLLPAALPPAPSSDGLILPAALPNDPSFSTEWGLQNTGQYDGTAGIDIAATKAWDITTGSRSVVVAIIDSGIDLTHPDLVSNLWTNPGEVAGNGLDDDHNGFVDDIHGWDFIDNDGVPQDGLGHGTHVAGIIGATGNNGIGITGVNWQVSLMVLRVQNDFGIGSTSAVINALEYATKMRRDYGINVVVTNNSWEAAGGYSSLLEDVIRRQGEAGITFVAAAGNHGTDSDVLPRYPGNYALPNVISVASLTPYGGLAASSDYGATTVDLAAPGTLIQSTWKGGGYGMLSGTSMAAPFVSGTVALLAAAKPGITVAEVRAAILGSTTPVAALVGRTVTGGRLNARAALAFIGAAPAPAPVAATLPFADTFNVPDGPLTSPYWVQRSGGFVVSGGAALSTSTLHSVMTLRGLAVANSSQRAAVSLSSARSIGLVARHSAVDQSMYLAMLTRAGSSGYAVQIYRQLRGQWTLLASGLVRSASGGLRFDVIGDRLTVSFNGWVVASARDSAITRAGGLGLRAVGYGARVDSYNAA